MIISRATKARARRAMRSIEFMEKYIADWDANVARSKTLPRCATNVLKQIRVWHGVHLDARVASYFRHHHPPH